MAVAIRDRFLVVVLLGAVTSALSLFALYRVLSITTEHRVEMARAVEAAELERLANGGTPSDHGATLIGMRGGVLGLQTPPGSWRPALRAALDGDGHTELVLDGDRLIMSARRLGDRTLWCGYLVQPPSWLRTWQLIVLLLTAATALLVAAAIFLTLRLSRSQSAEAELSRQLAHKERLAALGRVAAGVAHEVRNPLASIKLRLDLAAATAGLPGEVEHALGHATSEIARLDRLVSDLLVAAGRKVGPRQERSIGALLSSRVRGMAPWASVRGVDFAVDGDADALVDAESLGRAFDNLLRNAVEASPAGARVTARVRRDAGVVRVAVEDRGPGVAEWRASELFEPFFTTKPDGTGLGLAISRAIARAHGGDVTYARDGETTRFTIAVSA